MFLLIRHRSSYPCFARPGIPTRCIAFVFKPPIYSRSADELCSTGYCAATHEKAKCVSSLLRHGSSPLFLAVHFSPESRTWQHEVTFADLSNTSPLLSLVSRGCAALLSVAWQISLVAKHSCSNPDATYSVSSPVFAQLFSPSLLGLPFSRIASVVARLSLPTLLLCHRTEHGDPRIPSLPVGHRLLRLIA